MPVITIVVDETGGRSYHDGLTVLEAFNILVGVAKDYKAEIDAAAAEHSHAEGASEPHVHADAPEPPAAE